MLSHTQILDILTRVKEGFFGSPPEYEYRPVEREEVLGMTFKKGDDVRDRRTGESCTIIAGYTRYVTKVPGA